MHASTSINAQCCHYSLDASILSQRIFSRFFFAASAHGSYSVSRATSPSWHTPFYQYLIRLILLYTGLSSRTSTDVLGSWTTNSSLRSSLGSMGSLTNPWIHCFPVISSLSDFLQLILYILTNTAIEIHR